MRCLFWLGLALELGVAFHLVDHIVRGVSATLALVTAPFLLVGPVALLAVWKGRRWGAGLMAALSGAALVLGGWEHLLRPGPDRLTELPRAEAVVTLLDLALACVVGWKSWRLLRGSARRRLDRRGRA